MMVKARHNFFVYKFFERYTLWLMRRKFRKVQIFGGFTERNLPVLLVSNHISWWDGFWAMYVNLKLLKRKLHFMMLEDQLFKRPLFKYAGGFSVNKKARSLMETLDYTAGLLRNPENVVLVFPQGEIQSMHVQSFLFQKGIERILTHTEGRVQVLFVANVVDYFSDPKPGLYIYLKEYTDEVFDALTIQERYNAFYKECIEVQKGFKAPP